MHHDITFFIHSQKSSTEVILVISFIVRLVVFNYDYFLLAFEDRNLRFAEEANAGGTAGSSPPFSHMAIRARTEARFLLLAPAAVESWEVVGGLGEVAFGTSTESRGGVCGGTLVGVTARSMG